MISTSTLSQIQTDLQDWLSIQVPDNIVILAYNDFSSRIYRFEEENFPERQRQESSILTINGSIDLGANLTDIRDYDIGFEMYRVDTTGKLSLSNKFKRTHPANNIPMGYYIIDGVLHLSSQGQETVKFLYNKSRTVVARGTSPSAVTFGWDIDLEESFREFMGMKYFQSEQLPGNSNDANQMAQQSIMAYYSQIQSS